MAANIDGFYVVYFTSKSGCGAALIAMRRGRVVGADPMGVRFDGTYQKDKDDVGYDVTVGVDAPAGIELVQGHVSGPTGSRYEIRFGFRDRPDSAPYIRMETPLGPLNVRFVKLRGMDV
jgi:hypothetical protein